MLALILRAYWQNVCYVIYQCRHSLRCYLQWGDLVGSAEREYWQMAQHLVFAVHLWATVQLPEASLSQRTTFGWLSLHQRYQAVYKPIPMNRTSVSNAPQVWLKCTKRAWCECDLSMVNSVEIGIIHDVSSLPWLCPFHLKTKQANMITIPNLTFLHGSCAHFSKANTSDYPQKTDQCSRAKGTNTVQI